RGRLRWRGSRCSGIQIFGTVERVTRERAALGGLVARSHIVDSFERTPMTLSFPNKSRAFDATRRAVLFGHTTARWRWHSSSPEDALKRVQPDMQPDEAGLLRVFDSNWDLICSRTAKIYARGRRGSYDLVGADF